MTPTQFTLSKDFCDYILQSKEQSVAVAHLRSYQSDNESRIRTPHLDYHLHFLCYKNENSVGVVCLDTSDFLESDLVTFGEVSHSTFIQGIVKIFVSRLDVYFSNKETRDQIFCKAPGELWNQFNQLKESIYFEHLDSMKKFSLASGAKTVNTFEDEPFPYEELFQNGKIRYGIFETRRKQQVAN